MAQYTINTTALEETNLTVVVAAANKDIDAQNDALSKQTPPGKPIPHYTNTSYLTQRVADVLASYGRSHQDAVAAQCVNIFVSAPPDKQGQILALLGMSAYASLPPTELQKVLMTIGLSNFMQLSTEDQNKAFALAGVA